jgi:hypothetical protein
MVMLEWNAANQWLQAVAAPIINLIALCCFGIASFYSRFRLGFATLALAGLLYFVADTYWLVLKVQHTFQIFMLPKPFLRFLFPVQAVSMYMGIATQIFGIAALTIQACKMNGSHLTKRWSAPL